jgi:hypothetical protein
MRLVGATKCIFVWKSVDLCGILTMPVMPPTLEKSFAKISALYPAQTI